MERQEIDLRLIHGQPDAEEKKKADEGTIEWANRITNRRVHLGQTELLWQPCLQKVKDADLVVVQQENRLLINYLLLLRRKLIRQKLAFWGHGVNCQAQSRDSLKEKWKSLFIRQPDWWFAYTDFTREILLERGFHPERITVVQNAVDTAGLRAASESISSAELAALKDSLGIQGERVGVYCGAIYVHKRIGFLIEAAQQIRQKISDFELVIIGAGPDENRVREAASRHTWIHFVGPRFGREKALHLKLGQVFLMPGLVGLAIQDAFVLGQPMLTTDCGLHSPEISYLRHAVNGMMAPNNVADYVEQVVSVLGNPARLDEMKRACLMDAEKYTIALMADKFAEGIVQCLARN